MPPDPNYTNPWQTFSPRGFGGVNQSFQEILRGVRGSGGDSEELGKVAGAPVPRPPTQPRFPTEDELFGPLDATGGTGGANLARAQQMAASAFAALDAQFEQRKRALAEQYQLTETPEEKANIQHLLDIIEVQRKSGTKVIERVYTKAIAGASERADATRAMGEEAAARTAETFETGADNITESVAALASRFGGAMGAGGEPPSPAVEAAVADMHRLASIESAFDRRMFDVSADDISFLGEAMRPEMGAQVGALQRNAATASALSQFEHDRSVQQRIAAERAAWQQALQGLMMSFDQRRWGLEDQRMALAAQAGRGGGSGGVDPRREQFRIDQRMNQFEREQDEWNRYQDTLALRGFVPAAHADLATRFGQGEGLAGAILGNDLFNLAR